MVGLRLREGEGMPYYEYGSMNKAVQIMGQIRVFDQINQRASSLEAENRSNVSDYNNVLARFRALQKKYNSLVNEWNALENNKGKLNDNYAFLVKEHNDLVDKFNALVEQNDALLAEYNNFKLSSKHQFQLKESEILNLKQNLESTRKVASDTITDVNQQNVVLKNKVDALQLFKSSMCSTISKNKENFAKEVKKRSRENAKNELALKVTTTQSAVIGLLFTNSLTGNERLEFINQYLYEVDMLDNSKNVFSYSEAYAWLKRNDSALLSRIDLLKKI